MSEVVATRTELLERRCRVDLAAQGRDLLRDKRTALMRALAERSNQAYGADPGRPGGDRRPVLPGGRGRRRALLLTDDNFATIAPAVREGRAIYDNVVKFVRFQLTTSMGAILAFLGAEVVRHARPGNGD